MIRVANLREIALFTVGPVNANLPYAPTTTAAVLGRYVAPQAGKIKYAIITIATAGAVGNSTDLKETLAMQKRGVSGVAGAVLITTAPTVFSAVTGALVPAPAGGRVKMAALQGAQVVEGEIIEFIWTETGTLGTATRPTIQPNLVVFECNQNLSDVPA